MPIRERRCNGCGSTYEVLVLGSMARIVAMTGAVGEAETLRCAKCGDGTYTEVFNTQFTPTGLGGEAGVGRFYPYYDRALGPGKGLLVKDAKHREWLMRHEPNGTPREERLIPLDSKTDSATRGTWEDIADAEAAENEQIDNDYKAMVDQLTHEQPQTMAQIATHGAPDAG